MHVRNGADPGLAGTNSNGRRRPGEGNKQFFCRNLVDNLSRREEALAYFIFWGLEWFFFISVPNYSGSILSKQKPAAAKQEINSQPGAQSRGGTSGDRGWW